MVFSPDTAALTTGCFRRFSATALAMNARNVRLTPRSWYDALAFARNCATRVKSTSKNDATCAETFFDMIIWSAVILRILDHGSTRSPGHGSTAGCSIAPAGAAEGIRGIEGAAAGTPRSM